MKVKRFLTIIVGVLFLLTMVPLAGYADVPQLINYQGKLLEDGVPVNGFRTMTFSLWETDAGGNPASAIWWETQASVEVVEGIYDVQMGSVTALPTYLSDYDALYLQADIVHPTEGSQRLSPLLELTSTVFAIKAGDAENLDGRDSTYFAPTIHNHDSVYVNEDQANAITSVMIADSAITSADLGDSSVSSIQIATGAVGTTDIADDAVTSAKIAAGAVGSSEIADGSVTAGDMQDGAALAEILDNDGSNSGLDADLLDGYHGNSYTRTSQDYGRSGVAKYLYEGTSTLTSKYVNATGDTMSGSTSSSVLSVTNTGRGSGVYGSASGTTGSGVYGSAGNTGDGTNYGGYFSANGASGRGVYGFASGTIGRGVYGYATGASGRGVYGSATYAGDVTNYGGYFSALGASGRGVCGFALGASGRGVYGSATGASGRGVCGFATNDGDVTNYGGYFSASGASGFGVYGGTIGASGRGVYGSATGASAFAGYFVGDVFISGNYYASGTKSFVHPHPIDPSKEIVYVCLEGGESGVYVRGSSRLQDGGAKVELPEHFALVAAEEGLTVQVTPLDDCYGMFVVEKAPDQIVIKEMQRGTSNARFD